MRLALGDGKRILATPGARAVCPACDSKVQSKCGDIITWHWAHVADADCDPWAEPDSEWHRGWQSKWPESMREIVIGNHRADIRSDSGLVIELQHSPISPAEIAEREHHYGRMVWVFDATDAFDEDRLDIRRAKDKPVNDTYRTFRWKHPRKSVTACDRPVLLDMGYGSLLHIGRMYAELGKPCGGWGYLVDVQEFIGRLGGIP